jgi:hypothetical protein
MRSDHHASGELRDRFSLDDFDGDVRRDDIDVDLHGSMLS